MSSALVQQQRRIPHRNLPTNTITSEPSCQNTTRSSFSSSPLNSSQHLHQQFTSTITIPDISTLTIGVPELVLASKANDHLMAQSPPMYHDSPTTTTGSPWRVDREWKARRRPSHELDGGAGRAGDGLGDIVRDLGMMMSSQGALPIEEYTPFHHDNKHSDDSILVPGIDDRHHHHHHQQQRPIIGISRPSDESEEKRRLVEEWTVNGEVVRRTSGGSGGTFSASPRSGGGGGQRSGRSQVVSTHLTSFFKTQRCICC